MRAVREMDKGPGRVEERRPQLTFRDPRSSLRRLDRKGRTGRNTRSLVLGSCPAAWVEVNLRLQPPVFSKALGERSREGELWPPLPLSSSPRQPRLWATRRRGRQRL